MATYPVSQGGLKAKFNVKPDAGIEFTRMSDGIQRGFSDFVADSFTITITHFWLGSTDRDAIKETFYDANKTNENSVVTDEGTFDCYFINKPVVTDKNGPYSMLVSTLRGVKV